MMYWPRKCITCGDKNPINSLAFGIPYGLGGGRGDFWGFWMRGGCVGRGELRVLVVGEEGVEVQVEVGVEMSWLKWGCPS